MPELPLKLPDFIGIGPPRTGTTWLDRLLRERACFPIGVKETHFFTNRYHLGMEWYGAHFRHCTEDAHAGEFSPGYFVSAEARERIGLHIPGCRILCTLREPVARLYSHYRLWRKIGAAKHSFERVALNDDYLLSFTRYADHIQAWQRQFGAENVAVMIHEDSQTDRQDYVDRVCAFIGVPPIDLSKLEWEAERVHEVNNAARFRKFALKAIRLRELMERKRMYRLADMLTPVFHFWMGGGEEFGQVDPALEAQLQRRFLPEVEAMEELLQRDLPQWRRPGAEPPGLLRGRRRSRRAGSPGWP